MCIKKISKNTEGNKTTSNQRGKYVAVTAIVLVFILALGATVFGDLLRRGRVQLPNMTPDVGRQLFSGGIAGTVVSGTFGSALIMLLLCGKDPVKTDTIAVAATTVEEPVPQEAEAEAEAEAEEPTEENEEAAKEAQAQEEARLCGKDPVKTDTIAVAATTVEEPVPQEAEAEAEAEAEEPTEENEEAAKEAQAQEEARQQKAARTKGLFTKLRQYTRAQGKEKRSTEILQARLVAVESAIVDKTTLSQTKEKELRLLEKQNEEGMYRITKKANNTSYEIKQPNQEIFESCTLERMKELQFKFEGHKEKPQSPFVEEEKPVKLKKKSAGAKATKKPAVKKSSPKYQYKFYYRTHADNEAWKQRKKEVESIAPLRTECVKLQGELKKLSQEKADITTVLEKRRMLTKAE